MSWWPSGTNLGTKKQKYDNKICTVKLTDGTLIGTLKMRHNDEGDNQLTEN